MVYRKYSKKYTVKVYNFTFYQQLHVWTSRIEVDIKFPMKARVSMKKLLLLCMQKLTEVQDGNVCVKWSILPHLNVKKDAMKKKKR